MPDLALVKAWTVHKKIKKRKAYPTICRKLSNFAFTSMVLSALFGLQIVKVITLPLAADEVCGVDIYVD